MQKANVYVSNFLLPHSFWFNGEQTENYVEILVYFNVFGCVDVFDCLDVFALSQDTALLYCFMLMFHFISEFT